MTSFEPWPQRTAPNFYAGVDASFSAPGQSNKEFFTSQLSLQAEQVQEVCLRDPPETKVDLRDSIPKSFQLPFSQNVILGPDVHSDKPHVVDIQFKQKSGATYIYLVTAKKTADSALIEARPAGSSGAAFAFMRVKVAVPEVAKSVSDATVRFDAAAALKDVYAGFVEGLAPHTTETANAFKKALGGSLESVIPGGNVVLGGKFAEGFFRGLKEGGEAFLNMLKDAKNLAFDAKFRDEVMKNAAEIIGPMSETLLLIQTNPGKFFAPLAANAKPIGRVLGDELGKGVSEQIVGKTNSELFQWAGRLTGLVAFEVILQVATDAAGIGVVQGVKWMGEGAGMIGRLLPRLKGLLVAAEELKNVLRLKFQTRAAREAAKAAEEAVKAAEEAQKALKMVEEAARGAGKLPPGYTPPTHQLPPHVPRGGLRPGPANAASYGESVVEPEVLRHFLPDHLQMSAKAIGFDTCDRVSVVGTRLTEEVRAGQTIKVYEERIRGGTWTTIKGVSRPDSRLIRENVELAVQKASEGLKLARANQFERIEGNIAYRTVYAGQPDKILIVIRLETGTPFGYEPGLGLEQLAAKAIKESPYRSDIPAGVEVVAAIVRVGRP
ncbi:hypothetical protein H8A99_28220 [Bradyrhizobium sp. Arg68]|uniref:hypothetical protein n=1 Tax=Bradyrhizobium ivorense TaxID=2511166 RepID=UPI001E54A4C1|nr:hypothetical protein [Bradyrhizobium ivorense]MCC8940241.1 hypothetical protein [Bradyrhizobium ivorense]